MAYARNTDVPFERSIAEIVGLVRQAGADQVGQTEDRHRYTLQFALGDRVIRFRVPFPTPADVDAAKGPRQDAARVAAQMRRQRGRALLLVIKAKIESVESGVETLEEAFLANVVLPGDGATVYERLAEPLAAEYRTGTPSVLLLGGPGQ